MPEYQLRISCILPMRAWPVFAIALIGLVLITGIELLHLKFGTRGSESPKFLDAFDAGSSTGLVVWLSSALFFASAILSGVVYALRRHKLDDYRGRYRFWLWNACLLLVASIDCVTGLHQAIPYAVATFAKDDPFPNSNLWWVGAYVLLFGLSGLRIAAEVCASRFAAVFLLFTTSGFAATAGLLSGWTPIPGEPFVTLTRTATLLFSQWMLMLTLLSYGRYVNLDAQGMIQRKKAKKGAKIKRSKDKESSITQESDESSSPGVNSNAVADKVVRIDAAHLSSPDETAGGNGDSKKTITAPHFDPSGRKMSKAERKRLRP